MEVLEIVENEDGSATINFELTGEEQILLGAVAEERGCTINDVILQSLIDFASKVVP
jgi:uncharacterized protein (DUF1778 family)